MGTWLTAEVVLVVLVALCGVVILAGVVRLLGRDDREGRCRDGPGSGSGS